MHRGRYSPPHRALSSRTPKIGRVSAKVSRKSEIQRRFCTTPLSLILNFYQNIALKKKIDVKTLEEYPDLGLLKKKFTTSHSLNKIILLAPYPLC